MSKKTRQKSSKKSMQPSRAAAGKARRAAPLPAKAPAEKTRKASASKSGGSADKQSANAAAGASHKAPSKQLKLPGRRARVAPAAASPKIAAARPLPGNRSTPKPSDRKADVAAGTKPALAAGAKAPAFRLPRDGGDNVSLADFAGKKLVLFFYPRADTPGCTKEAIDFTRLARAFAECQTAVLGVSSDPQKMQEAFRDKHELAIPLASDEQHDMMKAYGAWGEKSMYGRTFQGVLRTTVLIGAEGRVLRTWRHVKVDGHADEVLAAARAP